MNVFQGTFPADNTAADGYAGTAPVEAFAPNGFGLHNRPGTCGSGARTGSTPTPTTRPPPRPPAGPPPARAPVMRGGSYLCHARYCRRYRVDSRSASEPDTPRATSRSGSSCVPRAQRNIVI